MKNSQNILCIAAIVVLAANAVYGRDYVLFKSSQAHASSYSYVMDSHALGVAGNEDDSNIYVFKTMRAELDGSTLIIHMGDVVLYHNNMKRDATSGAMVTDSNTSHFNKIDLELLRIDHVIYGNKFIAPVDFLTHTNEIMRAPLEGAIK